MGSADIRDPYDRETETGESSSPAKLDDDEVSVESKGTKVDLPRCETLTLPCSRWLAGVNGGTAALRAVRRRAQPMPSQLRFTLSISGSRGSSRNKNEKEWWSREVWPRRRRPLRTPARWSSRRSGQCGLTSARLRERDGRRGRGRRGGALGGLAWPETRWSGRESWPKHGVARRDRKRREWSALSKGRV